MNSNLDKVNEAGVLLIRLVHSLRTDEGGGATPRIKISDKATSAILVKVRHLLREVEINSSENSGLERSVILHKYAAIQAALTSFEEMQYAQSVETNLKIFRNHVEAIHGGPTAPEFGGKRIGNKLSPEDYYLRAATVVLWKHHQKHNDKDALTQLISDARTIIGMGTKQKIAKMVDNHDQGHDIDILESKSPLSVHISGIQDLVDNHGWQRLKDFT
jgi:hypothetical protein